MHGGRREGRGCAFKRIDSSPCAPSESVSPCDSSREATRGMGGNMGGSAETGDGSWALSLSGVRGGIELKERSGEARGLSW